MIKNININNFTVFKNTNIDFSPKINIIIGENGTGKSHLLKLLYALNLSDGNVSESEAEKTISNNLLKLFLPIDNSLWKLKSTNSSGQSEIKVQYSNDDEMHFDFNINSKSIRMLNYNSNHTFPKSIFIPPKEVLSFMKGFNSLYEKYDLSFDQSYNDICMSLNLPEVRDDKLQEKVKWAIKEIENICGGKFIFYGGGKVTFKSNDTEYSINAMAEGFRKIGMLSRLLETGVIQPGESGALLWDEPEANINPKLLRFIVETLLELSRNGQQVILATHNYILLKWFNSLINTNMDDHILYHFLYVDKETKEVKIKSTDNYLEITQNPISETFEDLLDYDIEKEMGDLGK